MRSSLSCPQLISTSLFAALCAWASFPRPVLAAEDKPADGKGAKGGDVMTKTHATGAGVTYGRRYLLGMIFNLVIGEDDDGNRAGKTEEPYTPPPGSITQDQIDILVDALEEKGASRKAFLQWAKQKRMEDIPAEHYDACVAAIASFKKA